MKAKVIFLLWSNSSWVEKQSELGENSPSSAVKDNVPGKDWVSCPAQYEHSPKAGQAASRTYSTCPVNRRSLVHKRYLIHLETVMMVKLNISFLL